MLRKKESVLSLIEKTAHSNCPQVLKFLYMTDLLDIIFDYIGI